MEYELKRHGVAIPFDAIAKRLASEKDTTGACVQQHLAKLRKEMFARGSWVPPLSGKPNSKQQQSDVRGLVMVKKKNGEHETREISWTEDAFKYVDIVNINLAKSPAKVYKTPDGDEDASVCVPRPLKNKRSAMDVPGDEVDPVDLPSDEEFHPSNRKSKKAKRVTRASAKSARNSNKNSFGAESDAGSESDSGDSKKQGGPRKPVMMALYQSEEEEELFVGIVILKVPQHVLAEYPSGVNEAYRNTHAFQIGNTDEEGEEVFDVDSVDSGSIFDANTNENYAEAFAHGAEYSVMDANTSSNYTDAFGGGPEYSIMDANTSENYAEAFGGGYEEGSDSDSDFGEQQVNTAMPNINPLTVLSPNQVTIFGNVTQTGSMFGPALHIAQNPQFNTTMYHLVNNPHAGHGNFIGMNTPASTPVHNASGQTAYGHNAFGPNTMRPNPLGQSNFHLNARNQDLLIGGPVNRVATGNFMGGQNTFSQNTSSQNAFSGGNGNGLGHGTSMSHAFVMGDTTSTANDPFVSNEDRFHNQIGGTQTGTGNHSGIPTIAVENDPIYGDGTGLPVNGPGVNDSNDGYGTQGSYGAQPQVHNYLDSFDVSEHLPLLGGRLLIRYSPSLTSNLTWGLMAIELDPSNFDTRQTRSNGIDLQLRLLCRVNNHVVA
jgi:hypothetical protein